MAKKTKIETTYRDEFIKTFNIRTVEDFNKYIQERKPINVGLFLVKKEKSDE